MSMPGALKGIRVLDFSQMMAGPLCAMILGDFGADVVKVEPPEGDGLRATGETRIGDQTEYFLSLNRNKRSIVLDLKSAHGQEVVRRLIADADVLIENFRPGTADRLGIGYDKLRALNPRLVYCSLSGFGQEGANRDRPALDPVIQAMSGIMQLTGTEATGPLRTGFPVSDYATPMLAVQGILAALMARHATGEGQRIDLSMLNATIFSMLPREGYYFATGKTPSRNGNAHYQLTPYNSFDTADQRQIFVIAHNDKFWQALMRALDQPDLAADARFVSASDRVTHRDAVNAALSRVFATRPASVWVERLAAEGVLFSMVRTLDEVFEDPQVEKDMVRHVTHPTAGDIRLLANPLQLSATPTSVRFPPPLLGEHTNEILQEIDMQPAGAAT